MTNQNGSNYLIVENKTKNIIISYCYIISYKLCEVFSKK